MAEQSSGDKAKVQEILERAEVVQQPQTLRSSEEVSQSQSNSKDFATVRYEDILWRVVARKKVGWTLIWLLIIQNLVVFGLVAWAFYTGQLQDLQIIFGVLIPATLGETAYMVKTIVSWLFTDIEYPN